jgi:hypothetical protein
MHVPRPLLLIRIMITVMLMLGVLGPAASPSLSAPGFAKDKHGQGHNGKSAKPGKDKHDNGKHKGQKKDKTKKDNGKHKGKGKGNKQVSAEPIAIYTIRVDCAYDAAADQSTCSVDADHPDGAKKIKQFVLSADDICAPVISSDANYVDPDPNTGATGYRSTDPEGKLVLVLSGKVTAGGTATYWIKAASNIFPATGTGLICANDTPAPAQQTAPTQPAADVTPTPAASPAPEVTDTTGSIVVRAADCPIAAPQADYDWYGQCTPVSAGSRYRLTRIDTATRDGMTTSTDATGQAMFRSLPPGTYQLTQAEGDWCYAQSDNVNSDGNLNVAAGQRTTVWIFVCAGT